MDKRRKYTKEFKEEVVNYYIQESLSSAEVAEKFGLRDDTVRRWRREFTDKTKSAFTGQGNPRDEEIARLKKEIANLKMERDILKKAMAIFSAQTK